MWDANFLRKKGPYPLDRHVGRQIRARRILMRLTQQDLGELLGISFQQIQKYELGPDRIHVGRLFEIAKALDLPVTHFFEGFSEGSKSQASSQNSKEADVLGRFLSEGDGVELTRTFVKIKDPKMRRHALELVKAVAELKGD